MFGRRQSSHNERTPQDRERARLEREARRAAREDRPAPDLPPQQGEDELDMDTWDAPALAEHPEVDDAPPASESDLEWVEPPAAEQPEAHDAPAADDDPTPLAHEGRPAWDDTGAWDASPPARETPAAPSGPTLGEEFAAVDRGWFEDDVPHATEQAEEPVMEEPDQPQADHPAGEEPDPPRSEQPAVEEPQAEHPVAEESAPPQPAAEEPEPRKPSQETVEWDTLAGAPKKPVEEPAGPPTRRFERADPPAAAAPIPRASARPVPETHKRRFGDEHERPVPVRRAPRPNAGGRTLPPPPPGPGEKGPRGPLPVKRVVAGLALLLAIAGALYLINALFQPLAAAGTGSVQVAIEPNSGAGDIGKVLEREGVVDSAFFFTIRARLAGKNLQAGDFTLKQGMPYGDALDALAEPPAAPKTVKIMIPEGRARHETAPLVEQAGLEGSYVKATERSGGRNPADYGAPRGTRSLEGFLFPATYELDAEKATSRALVGQQLQAFRDNIAKVDMRRARRRNLTRYDVLIIASMVEREASVASERRLVAAVIHNRLREGMPLGIDATIRYATRNWHSPLKQSELNIDSPYNSRRRTGLPPTPIGSPGLASIRAAANPANVDYLYYVIKPCGKGAHSFSATDTEFERDRQAYERKRAELGGKSPVDC